jgi:hypothetical protein
MEVLPGCASNGREEFSSREIRGQHTVAPISGDSKPSRKYPVSPITEPSSLLQVGPPQANASVLSPRGFLPLCFSLSIDGLVPAVPHKSLYRTHALDTPTAARPVIRLLTGLSQKTASPLVSTAPDELTTRPRKVCLRSSFRYSPAPGLARDFSPDAHHHSSLPPQLGLV